MPELLYPTDQKPCIPIRFLDRHQESLGWRDVLLHAHEIEDLALPHPPAASAALRILVTVTARITGLDDPEMSAGEWATRRHALLKTPDGFGAEAVHDYFDQYVWDLFDSDRPFLQDPRLAHQCQERAGINKLVFGRPEGNNLAWLSPHADTDPQPLPSDQALWHLLTHHYYGAAGTCSARTVAGHSASKAKAGPLRSTVSFHPLGRTLYETLLAGLPKPSDQWPDSEDTCPWEEPALPDPAATPPPVTWPGRLLTGRSCHAALLIPTSDGQQVTSAYLTWGTQTALPATDPYLIHRINTHPQRPASQRYKPRSADADRALWRDLDALLLAGDETSTVHRPDVFTTLNDLPQELRASLRVRAHGFDQDGKTMNRTWYTALTPPVWPWIQEDDPSAAERLVECRTAAEDIGALLDTVSKKAWSAITSPPAKTQGGPAKPPRRLPAWTRNARAMYWPRAETTFWNLLDHPHLPARAAFINDAITTLRTVTRPVIAQHFRAAQVTVAAVAELRRHTAR
ncbi:type I-E CRISPR-associated protein Cse1/CasA [Streptomyces platensis]|uniref:type I-E CRISPR-associated protein Cse1/CasA n=1 Tax=Streptomyces platensis TaxID=58346 RepID=UPI0036B42844